MGHLRLGVSKPDSEMFIGVHPLCIGLFDLQICIRQGGLLSSGDDHVPTFSPINLQEVIITQDGEVVNILL